MQIESLLFSVGNGRPAQAVSDSIATPEQTVGGKLDDGAEPRRRLSRYEALAHERSIAKFCQQHVDDGAPMKGAMAAASARRR
jgi:hypothetical protein